MNQFWEGLLLSCNVLGVRTSSPSDLITRINETFLLYSIKRHVSVKLLIYTMVVWSSVWVIHMPIEWCSLLIEVMNLVIHYVRIFFLLNFGFVIIFNLYDLTLMKIELLIERRYNDTKRRFVKKPEKIIVMYKFVHAAKKILTKARTGYLRYPPWPEDNPLFEAFEKKGWIRKLFTLFVFPSLNTAILSMIITILICNKGLLHIPHHINWTRVVNEVAWLMDKLKLLPLVITITLIAVARYYGSIKGQFVRGAAQANRNTIEKSLQLHREMAKAVRYVLYEGANNLEYAIRNRERLVWKKLKELSPHIREIYDGKIVWGVDRRSTLMSEEFVFYDVSGISEICEVMERIKSQKLDNTLGWILAVNLDFMLLFRFKNYKDERLSQILNQNFFTRVGVKSLFECSENDKYLSKEIREKKDDARYQSLLEEQILVAKKHYEEEIDNCIVAGIEMWVDLSFYVKAIDKLIHPGSNRYKRFFQFIIGKE